ncbi:vitamin K epoxide reductase family protein [Paraconexibacter algicola]|uniref:Vitamin K epoxide reductase n=1 Tax=Paraconexibacter algicola TaxID=2133960 RepID=A0A2T4UM70_9ACTN|nr:vitamin K epoxide reductase family protein [Paraconexibacter algicola]PTL60314.1 vitamin K epoxide reductase [Paraconexibacter algicola]
MSIDPIRNAPAFLDRVVGWVLLVPGAIALVAAIVLMVEKVRVLEDPTHVPACTIDAVLACGSVLSSDQAEAFGFPNPLIGIAGFGAITAFGLVLVAGGRLPRSVWLITQAGATFAVVFVHWLIFQSVYRIEALCPYCMVVWAMTIPIFVYLTLANATSGRLAVPDRLQGAVARLAGLHGVVLTVWLLAVAAVIAQGFWDYWMDKL